MPDPTRTKFTVYLDRQELVDLDREILDLREQYGIAVSRSQYIHVMMLLSNRREMFETFLQANS